MTKTDLKVFSFSGFGNYSQSFGWDNGLSCTLGECTTMERALEDQSSLADYNGWSYGLPASPVKGVYYTLNEYGGSRNVEGYVIAFSRRDAIKMLAEFEDTFEVVEYERD